MTRNTIQRSLVLKAVLGLHNHPTADEIYDEVIKVCPSISKGTVYRNLNLLAESGEIRRVAVANAPDRYDFAVYPHAHFRCKACGRVFDYVIAEKELINDRDNPDLKASDYDLVFSGLCKNCGNF
ncbi:MAG: Fur family transcriptional regulator [Acutalibacteraceae bacterium]|nr:transcriptional repressor [Oscillospiraceae bacterium]